MPIYEYKCEACGHRMEALQKMADDALTDCPECDAPKLKKLMSAVAFRLKGSGWYETDFKAGDKKNLADSGDSKPSSDEKTAKSSDKTAEKAKSDKSTSTTSSNKADKKAVKKAKPSK